MARHGPALGHARPLAFDFGDVGRIRSMSRLCLPYPAGIFQPEHLLKLCRRVVSRCPCPVQKRAKNRDPAPALMRLREEGQTTKLWRSTERLCETTEEYPEMTESRRLIITARTNEQASFYESLLNNGLQAMLP